MRYIGGKSLLLEAILSAIPEDVVSVLDIFSGSGVVSNFLKRSGFEVYSNDFLYFSYVLARGTTGINSRPEFRLLRKNPLEVLNSIKKSVTDDCFVYHNYSPNGGCDRMYFQNDNALKIDWIRQQIEAWKDGGVVTEDEYYYLLASLLNAVPYVSNITGTYGAYLKFWDKRTFNPLELKEAELYTEGRPATCYCGDYRSRLWDGVDLLYADPPYNSREYLPNYHVLETIARYDAPVLKGVTGMRPYAGQKSDFCRKNKVEEAFETLVRDAHARYVLISYNNEGLISTERLTEICKSYARRFRLTEIPYRRYKNKIPNNADGLKEQLYFVEKKG